MSIASVSLAGLAPQLGQPGASTDAGGASGGSFGGIMDRLLGSAAESHQNAEASLRSLAVGETDNLHAVMLQMAQADLSFRLVLEVRNRLAEAYQEIMKMQV
jgi:flagellar hook-basal body complex protein FliE